MASCGVDFGTSNSAVALPNGKVLPLDTAGQDPRLFRSVLFFPEGESSVHAGQRAIDEYLLDPAGRFIQSIKSWLPSASFRSTQIRNRTYSIEQLVGLLLQQLRELGTAHGAGPLDDVVMGRPAVFSPDPAADALAEERLERAALEAGFQTVRFVIEPIAAALAYEAQLDSDERVLVGDFGAGTSDFTLMKLGPSRKSNPDRRADVVGSAGVRIGGDNFDAEIMPGKLLRHFGAGSSYVQPFSTQRLPIPQHVLRKLLGWHEMSFIREKSTQELMEVMEKTGDRPLAIRALRDLVMENLGYQLFRAIEAAKIELSSREETLLTFDQARIQIEERITRAEFDAFCAPLVQGLEACVEGLLARVGDEAPIDAVFLTGGTSNIPGVRALFERRFGRARLRTSEAFTSVASGLGRAAAADPGPPRQGPPRAKR